MGCGCSKKKEGQKGSKEATTEKGDPQADYSGSGAHEFPGSLDVPGQRSLSDAPTPGTSRVKTKTRKDKEKTPPFPFELISEGTQAATPGVQTSASSTVALPPARTETSQSPGPVSLSKAVDPPSLMPPPSSVKSSKLPSGSSSRSSSSNNKSPPEVPDAQTPAASNRGSSRLSVSVTKTLPSSSRPSTTDVD